MVNQGGEIMYTIEVLTADSLKESDVTEIDSLMTEMFGKPLDTPISRESLLAAVTESRVVVARNDAGAIVGMATLASYPRVGIRMGWVEDVDVSAAYRRQGIATAIMNKVHELAREQGIRRIELLTQGTMKDAHALYRTLGYRQHPEYPWRFRLAL